MDLRGFRLIRILVVVNIFYGLSSFAIDPTNRYDSCDAECMKLRNEKMSVEIQREKRDLARDEREDSGEKACKDVKSEYADTLNSIREGCKGTGAKSDEACIQMAEKCGESAQSSGMAFLSQFAGAAASACSTKDQATTLAEQKKDQQDKLDEAASKIEEKYTKAMDRYGETIDTQYEVLMDIAQKNQGMRDLSIETGKEAQDIERNMRREFMKSIQVYHQKQRAVADMNRELVRLSSELGDLPIGYMEECVEAAKIAKRNRHLALQALSEELNSGLSEVSSDRSSTISSYSSAKETALRKHKNLNTNITEETKANYQSCLKRRQKMYAEEYKKLKARIDQGQTQVVNLAEEVTADGISIQEDLRQARDAKSYLVNRAESNMRGQGENIGLTRMQYNSKLNSAIQGIQAASEEMKQFQTKSGSQQNMQMMGGIMGVLTGSGGAGLGDVQPYIGSYKAYQEELISCARKVKSSGSRLGSNR